MPWKCPVCGYENSDDALFCIQCGTKRPDNVQQTPAIEQVVQPPPQPVQQQVTSQPVQASAIVQQEALQPTQSQQPTQQVLQPQAPTGKYYIIFITTPVSALNKTKLPLDFDVFESISIGRSPENVIVIPDPEISRRHAIISLEGGKLYIEDLNSTNGTYVYDGKLFQPVKGKQEISPGSVIKLGSSTILKIVTE